MNSVEIFEYWMDHTELYIKKMYGKRFPDLDESEKDLIQKSCLFYKPDNLFIKQEDSCDNKQVEQVGEGAAKTEKASQEETIAKAFEAIQRVEPGNIKYSKEYTDKLKSLGHVNDRIDRGTQVLDTENEIVLENHLVKGIRNPVDKGTVTKLVNQIFTNLGENIEYNDGSFSYIDESGNPIAIFSKIKNILSSYVSESFTDFPSEPGSLDVISSYYGENASRSGSLINKYRIKGDEHTVELIDGDTTTIANLATGIQNYYQGFGDNVLYNDVIMNSEKVKSQTILGFIGQSSKPDLLKGRSRKTISNPQIGGDGERKQRPTKTGRKLTNEDGTTEDEQILTTILARDVLDSFTKDELGILTVDAFRGFHNRVNTLEQPKKGSGSHGQSSRGENVAATINNFKVEDFIERLLEDYIPILGAGYNLEKNGSTHTFSVKDVSKLIRQMSTDAVIEDNYNKLNDFVNDPLVNEILKKDNEKLPKFSGHAKLIAALNKNEKIDLKSVGIGSPTYFTYLFETATEEELTKLMKAYPEFIPVHPTKEKDSGKVDKDGNPILLKAKAADFVHIFDKTAQGVSPTGRGGFVGEEIKRKFTQSKRDIEVEIWKDESSFNRPGGEGGGLEDEEGHNRFLERMNKFARFQTVKMKVFGKTPYLYEDHHRRFIADSGDNSPCNTILMRKDAHSVVAHMLQKASHSPLGIKKIKSIIDDAEGKYPKYKLDENEKVVEVKEESEGKFQQQYIDLDSFNKEDDEGNKLEEDWTKDSSNDPKPLLPSYSRGNTKLEGSLTTVLIPIITSVSEKIVEGGSPCFDIFPPLN